MRTKVVRALVVALVLGFSLSASAAARQFVINHEGRLLDGSDQPVTGTKNITFALTANPQKPASGSDDLTWTATYAVSFDDHGHYAVVLGQDTNKPGTTTPNPPLTQDAIAPFSAGPMYLVVTIDDVELSPRLQLAPSALAMNALALAGHPASDFALAANTYTRADVDGLVDTKATAAVNALSAAVDGKLALKANAADVYTKVDDDAKLAAKADAANVYAKTEMDGKLLLKADALTTYSKSDVDTRLALKADQATTYTKSEVDAKVAPKVGSVTAADTSINVSGTGTDPKVAVNTSVVQARVSGTCPAGNAITAINADGTVTCSPVAPQRVVRWMSFNTYEQSNNSWFAGNSAELFGGVRPSDWTDGNYRAVHMKNDVDTIRTLLTRKAYVTAPNAVIVADTWSDASSTNGRVTVALLRVKNTTGAAISWTMCFNYTNYGGWAESAGVALNGAEVWNASGNGYANSSACPSLSLPANKTSSVLISTTSSPPYSTGSFIRNNLLAFYNNSLNLPSGLQMVDDVDNLPAGALW